MRFLKLFFLLVCLNLSGTDVFSQMVETDSLKKALSVEKDDKNRVNILESLSYAYVSTAPDTALLYAMEGLKLAESIEFLKGQAICINALGNVYFHTGDNAKALEMYLRYLQMKVELKDPNLAVAYFNIAGVYTEEKEYPQALEYFHKAKAADEKSKDTVAILYDLYALGNLFVRMKEPDSAFRYMNLCRDLAIQLDDKNLMGAILNSFGELYLSKNELEKADEYFRMSIPHVQAVNDFEVLTSSYFGIAKVLKDKNLDSSVTYARRAFRLAQDGPFYKLGLEITTFLSEAFRQKAMFDSAYYYQGMNISIKDSLFNIEQVKKVQNLKMEEQQRQQAIETEKMKFRNRINLFLGIFASLIFLIAAAVFWRDSRLKRRANRLLQQEKEKVESTLSDLRLAQAQLIQSAKMASLGELTAGIAHEIKNPLNFVNNFSELNQDLLTELHHEIDKGNYDEVRLIAADIMLNEEKINHHGKRADDIVKNMLQHSRISTGEMEYHDLNDLVDECMRIAYHGFRAKEESFHSELKTNPDPAVGRVLVMPQDFSRVLLNLYNNAFYAMNQRVQVNSGFQPRLTATTTRLPQEIEIRIKDNGGGIPEVVQDKIFQPFFTTKPTGQGTGLGLSLSYDIIKSHGGDIRINNSPGEGVEFIVTIPIR